MADEPLAKTFKSGNSTAIRIPAELALEIGAKWTPRFNAAGELVLTPVEKEPRRLNVDAFWGKGCGMKMKTLEERTFDPRPSELRDR